MVMVMDIAAAYIRVSTEEQGEFSLDAQLDALNQYAIKNNIILDNNFIFREDGVSGRTADKRPEFQRMIALAKKKKFSIILVHKFDRFSRSREDSVVYKSLLRKECGVKVVSITEQLEDDKFSVILEGMLEAMAEYYSLNLSDEVLKGTMERAKRGLHNGKAPLGYDMIDGQLVINEDEKKIVQLIFNKYLENSQTSIARYLNLNRILTKSGSLWDNNKIKYILSNPKYIGSIRYNKTKKRLKNKAKKEEELILSKGQHEAIIDLETFEKVQTKLKANTTYSLNNNYKNKHWLHYILKCANCGSSLTLSTAGKSRPNSDISFRCPKYRYGQCISSGSITSKKISQLVTGTLKTDLQNVENIEIKFRKAKENLLKEYQLKSKLEKTYNILKLLNNAYESEIDTLEEYKQKKEKIKEEQDFINNELQSLQTTDSTNFSLNYLSILLDDNGDNISKNKTIKSFINSIDVDLILKTLRIHYLF